jgi:hypothetical protein
MVTKITVPQSVRRALNYNEQKVKQGKAECLHAANFLKDADQMNFHEKLERFTRNIELNKSKTNTLHISLNFDKSDHMTSEKMINIANDYMQKIGFGNQPFLVYKHNDAGHDHCHIVTTNIKDDGKRIDTFQIGKKLSEPARKSLEQEYGLTKAEGRMQTKPEKIDFTEKIEYGKSETKRSITNVLDAVLDQYKYASLHELNAVLRLFNVEADRGKEGSRTHEKKGLYFRILNDKGHKIGVPIKASSIYSRPMLDELEKKFAANTTRKQDNKLSVQTAIAWTMSQQPDSLKDFISKLKAENIDAVLRQSKDGQLYGLTYVDHGTKSVFNGSELGKKFSAKSILDQLNPSSEIKPGQAKENIVGQNAKNSDDRKAHDRSHDHENNAIQTNTPGQLVNQLLQSESASANINSELREDDKKRRRRLPERDEEHEM